MYLLLIQFSYSPHSTSYARNQTRHSNSIFPLHFHHIDCKMFVNRYLFTWYDTHTHIIHVFFWLAEIIISAARSNGNHMQNIYNYLWVAWLCSHIDEFHKKTQEKWDRKREFGCVCDFFSKYLCSRVIIRRILLCLRPGDCLFNLKFSTESLPF